MNAVFDPEALASAELHLCLLESLPSRNRGRRLLAAGVASVLAHVLLVSGWSSLPADWLGPRPPAEDEAMKERRSVPLVAPPIELTQREKNRGQVTKELDLEQLQANLRAPEPAPAAPPRPQRITLPAASLRPAAAPAPLAEPPSIEAANRPQPPAPLGASLEIHADTPPPPPAQTPPKVALESPGSPAGVSGGSGSSVARVPPPPRGTVDEAMHQALRRGGGGGIVVGDAEDGGPPSLPGGGAPSSPAKYGGSVELLSDPAGVDFRPYLVRVLAAVKRNWYAVIPESARMGERRGKVLIQFAIDRQGRVPKLVIAMPSGAEALDRAAVAGISASNPFPPLPPEFKGEHIRLQLAFLYNMAR